MAIGRRASPYEANWSTLVEDFQASSKQFYTEVEAALARREVPQLTSSRVFWSEAGALSGQREYLHLQRGMYHFDICAAPFGSGFFFSWWFTVRLPSPIPAVIFILLALPASWFFLGLIKAACLIPIGWLLIGLLVRTRTSLGNYFLAIPILGKIWELAFLPLTYYERDTQAMYRAAVDSAVQEVIGQTTNLQAVRDSASNATPKAALEWTNKSETPKPASAAPSPFKRPDLSSVLGQGPRE
jgi:hypothetical protein